MQTDKRTANNHKGQNDRPLDNDSGALDVLFGIVREDERRRATREDIARANGEDVTYIDFRLF